MNGGRIISKVLQQYGVQHLFTLCGGHISPIYVEAEKDGIQIIDVRHEASAVFGADALARLSGVPGVAAVTAGPGVTNSITALKNAQLAESPVVLIGGATATLLRKRGALQDIDQLSLVKSSVKWYTRITRKNQLAPAFHKALRICQSGVPGPVFIECPVDLLYDESTVREWYGQKNEKPKSIQGKLKYWYINRHLDKIFQPGGEIDQAPFDVDKSIARVNSSDVNYVQKQLIQSKKPVLVIGSGAMQIPQKAVVLSRAVEKLGVPVFLSGMARGLLGAENEVQYRHKRKLALRESDCIILAGVPCDFRLDYGSHLNREATKIFLHRDKSIHRKNIKPSKAIASDPALFIIELQKRFSTNPDWSAWRSVLDEREEKRETEISTMAKEKVKGINPVALLQLLEKIIPDNSIIIVDGGDFAATASYTLRPRRALTWLDPGVFGTLGVGGGFALGAALHSPADYVWIIYGDGSAAYSLTEFDTFKKMGLKVCAIVGNNGSWEQIARDQIHLLGRKTATTLPFSDYQLMADAFGGAGERIDKIDQFQLAVQRAIESMDHHQPYLINAIIGSTDFRKGSISM